MYVLCGFGTETRMHSLVGYICANCRLFISKLCSQYKQVFGKPGKVIFAKNYRTLLVQVDHCLDTPYIKLIVLSIYSNETQNSGVEGNIIPTFENIKYIVFCLIFDYD